jgi:adenylate kinase family enzyme
MDVYHKNTEPIIAYYEKQGILRRLNADISGDLTLKQLLNFLDESQRPDKD